MDTRTPFTRRLCLAIAGLLAILPFQSASAFSGLNWFNDFSVSTDFDYWAWPKDTITYRFDSDFSAAFPDPDIKEQVRLAFKQWATVNDFARGSVYSFARNNGPRNFCDIRSISLHEIGHVLGFNHPDQAAALSLNFTPSGDGYVSAPIRGGEVMLSTVAQGAYNHILSLDEMDGYFHHYGLRNLTFVEVPADAYADITIFTFTDPRPRVLARGAPDCICLPPFYGPTPASFGRLRFNLNSGTPIGFQKLGMNWRIKSTTGRSTRAITVQTAGTQNPTPIQYSRNSGSTLYEFTSFETTLLPVRLDNEFHTWRSPRSGPIPPTESFSIGLELDVWDWTVASVRLEDDAGGVTGSFALLSTSSWFHTNTTATPAAPPEADGETVVPPIFVLASGIKIVPSGRCTVSGLAVADVTGMNLPLGQLNADTLDALRAQQRVETIANFGQRTLAENQPFVLVFQGGQNNLPPDLLESGNYLLLNRPDLEDKELLVFARSDTDEGFAEMYALVSKKVVGMSAAPCITLSERESNDAYNSATDLGFSRSAFVGGTISRPGDVDFYGIHAPYNARIWCTVDTGGPQGSQAASRDSFLTAYGIDGTTALENDDDDGSGNGGDGSTESNLASAIAGLRTVNSGTHFVSVRAFSPQATILPYHMFLTVSTDENELGSEIEPNGAMNIADPVLMPNSMIGLRSGRINQPGDEDYFSVFIPAGMHVLHVSVDADPERDGVNPDVAVALLDQNGNQLYEADHTSRGSPGNPPAEAFLFLFTLGAVNANGAVCYVRVRGASPNDIGTYHLMTALCKILPPDLGISRDPNGVQLTWPLNAPGFRVVASSGLNGPWLPVQFALEVLDASYAVQLPASPSTQFFRLTSP